MVALAARARLEVVDDRQVGVEDEQALVVGDRVGEPAVGADRDDRLDAGGVGDDLVLLTERARGVDQPGAVLGGDELGREDVVGLGVADVVVERRQELPAQQVGALEPLDDVLLRVVAAREEVLRVGGEPRLADDVALAACR